MRIFLDTALIDEVQQFAPFIDGITTNPSLMAKSGQKPLDVVHKLLDIVSGPISVQVLANTHDEMVIEGKALSKISDQIVVKLPITEDGLIACRKLAAEGISTNMTLCFSVAQAILAAKCGATYVSPFIGRLDDLGENGLDLISDIRMAFDNYFDTKILCASLRSVYHVEESAKIGADAVTIPVKILKEMLVNNLTTVGMQKFESDMATVVNMEWVI